ncbi:hypothetical protein COOONC_03812 [Cooperia oncophora]
MLQCDEYINYAYSGAKSGQDNFYFEGWSGVGWQVQKYLENHLHLSGEPLIVFQAGGVSDYFTGEKDTASVVANIESSIENITKAMHSGTLLVLTLLDLGNSPGVRGADEGSDLEQRIGELVADTNRHLGRIVYDSERGARRLNPKLRIRLLDINPSVMEAMNSLNITEPFTYQTLNVEPRSVYGYAFHDLWNPSTIVHHALAEEIVKQLQDL